MFHKIKKEDVFFLLSPFVLTGLFIVFGYNVLIAQTPEARVNPPAGNEVELLDSSDVSLVTSQVNLGETFEGPIVSVPRNSAQLENFIKGALETDASVVYISIPVVIKSDSQFLLMNVEDSSQENVVRWIKKTISTIHENNLNAVLSMTLNASTTIQDPAVFAISYSDFLEDWSSIANEYGVSIFNTGLTVGHPLYSQIAEEDMKRVISTVQKRIRATYAGNLGINLCCISELDYSLSSFNYLNVISTPEYPFVDLQAIVKDLTKDGRLKVYYYDQGYQKITTNMP